MPDKSNFTPDEWKLLLESVMMAGIAVSAAEPSGLWGQHVAEASKEGGFLGIGGVAVSEAEKATLTEIASALRLAA